MLYVRISDNRPRNSAAEATEVSKAYAALTDDAARKNYEKCPGWLGAGGLRCDGFSFACSLISQKT